MQSPKQIFAIVYREDIKKAEEQPIQRVQSIPINSFSRSHPRGPVHDQYAYNKLVTIRTGPNDPLAGSDVPMEDVGVYYHEERLAIEVSFTTFVAGDDVQDHRTCNRTFIGKLGGIGTIHRSMDGKLRCMVDGNEWRQMLDEWKNVTQCLKEVLSNAASKLHSSTVTGSGDGRTRQVPQLQPAELLNILSTAADAADRLERDFSEWKRTLSLEGLTIISATTTITRETPYGNYGDTETVLEDLTEETKNSIKNIADFIELDLVRRVESLFQRASNILSMEEAKRAREQNASMKRMSWITFIFLPLVFVVSIYGMNVDVLENNPKWYTTLYFAIPLFALVMSSFHLIKHRRAIYDYIRKQTEINSQRLINGHWLSWLRDTRLHPIHPAKQSRHNIYRFPQNARRWFLCCLGQTFSANENDSDFEGIGLGSMELADAGGGGRSTPSQSRSGSRSSSPSIRIPVPKRRAYGLSPLRGASLGASLRAGSLFRPDRPPGQTGAPHIVANPQNEEERLPLSITIVDVSPSLTPEGSEHNGPVGTVGPTHVVSDANPVAADEDPKRASHASATSLRSTADGIGNDPGSNEACTGKVSTPDLAYASPGRPVSPDPKDTLFTRPPSPAELTTSPDLRYSLPARPPPENWSVGVVGSVESTSPDLSYALPTRPPPETGRPASPDVRFGASPARARPQPPPPPPPPQPPGRPISPDLKYNCPPPPPGRWASQDLKYTLPGAQPVSPNLEYTYPAQPPSPNLEYTIHPYAPGPPNLKRYPSYPNAPGLHDYTSYYYPNAPHPISPASSNHRRYTYAKAPAFQDYNSYYYPDAPYPGSPGSPNLRRYTYAGAPGLDMPMNSSRDSLDSESSVLVTRGNRNHRQNSLLIAVSRQNSQSVLLQLRHDPKTLNLRSDFGAELLRIATDNGDLRTLRLLTDAGADVNIPFNHETAIFGAVIKGNIDMMRELIQSMRADVRVRDKDGRTLVMIAAWKRQADVLKLLLESHFKREHRFVRLRDNERYGRQAIHYAAAGGSARCFDLLFQHLGDVSELVVEDLNGETPLEIAYGMNKGEDMFKIVSHIGRTMWDKVDTVYPVTPKFVKKVCEVSRKLVQKTTVDLKNIVLLGEPLIRSRGSDRRSRRKLRSAIAEADAVQGIPKLKLLSSFLNGQVSELPLMQHVQLAQSSKLRTFNIGPFKPLSFDPNWPLTKIDLQFLINSRSPQAHFQSIIKQWLQYKYEMLVLLLAFRYRFSTAAKAGGVVFCTKLLRDSREAEMEHFVRIMKPVNASGSHKTPLPDPLPPSSGHPGNAGSSEPAMKPKLLVSLHCLDQVDVATFWVDEGWKEPTAPSTASSSPGADSDSSNSSSRPPDRTGNTDGFDMDTTPKLHLVDRYTLLQKPDIVDDRTPKLELTPLEFTIKFNCKRMLRCFLAALGSVDKLAPVHIRRSSSVISSIPNKLTFYYRMTPLDIALRHEQVDIIHLLVSDFDADFLREEAPYEDYELEEPTLDDTNSRGLINAATNTSSTPSASQSKGKGSLSQSAKSHLQSSRAKREDFERILEAHVQYKGRRIAEIRAEGCFKIDPMSVHFDEEYEFYKLEPEHFVNSILESSWLQDFNTDSPDPPVEPESSQPGNGGVRIYEVSLESLGPVDADRTFEQSVM